jgi:hypothetical protein
MYRTLVLLIALAAAASAAEAQDSWVRGDLIVGIRGTSLDQVNWDGLLRGELRTGLASLDSLIQRTGVLAITPLTTVREKPMIFLLQFGAEIDVPAMANLYMKDEHVEYAQANYAMPTAAQVTPWSVVKRPAARRSTGWEGVPRWTR